VLVSSRERKVELEGRSKAAFSELRMHGVDGLEGQLDTVDLVSLVTQDDKNMWHNLNDKHKMRRVKYTSHMNNQTRYGMLASSIHLPLGRGQESCKKREKEGRNDT
jgi:hypothetical protein